MKIIFILLFISYSIPALSQQIIRGNILDKTSSEPLQYAVISQVGRGTSVSSDKEGYFQLNIPVSVDSLNISISCITVTTDINAGYHSRMLAVSRFQEAAYYYNGTGPVDPRISYYYPTVKIMELFKHPVPLICIYVQ